MGVTNLAELAKVASSEEASEEFLRTKGVLKTFDACPFCGSFPPGKVRRQRYKCYRCKREWSVRRESLLEDLRIPFSKFVLALKLFVLEVPVNRAHKELGISYNTAHKVYSLLRKAIGLPPVWWR